MRPQQIISAVLISAAWLCFADACSDVVFYASQAPASWQQRRVIRRVGATSVRHCAQLCREMSTFCFAAFFDGSLDEASGENCHFTYKEATKCPDGRKHISEYNIPGQIFIECIRCPSLGEMISVAGIPTSVNLLELKEEPSSVESEVQVERSEVLPTIPETGVELPEMKHSILVPVGPVMDLPGLNTATDVTASSSTVTVSTTAEPETTTLPIESETTTLQHAETETTTISAAELATTTVTESTSTIPTAAESTSTIPTAAESTSTIPTAAESTSTSTHAATQTASSTSLSAETTAASEASTLPPATTLPVVQPTVVSIVANVSNFVYQCVEDYDLDDVICKACVSSECHAVRMYPTAAECLKASVCQRAYDLPPRETVLLNLEEAEARLEEQEEVEEQAVVNSNEDGLLGWIRFNLGTPQPLVLPHTVKVPITKENIINLRSTTPPEAKDVTVTLGESFGEADSTTTPEAAALTTPATTQPVWLADLSGAIQTLFNATEPPTNQTLQEKEIVEELPEIVQEVVVAMSDDKKVVTTVTHEGSAEVVPTVTHEGSAEVVLGGPAVVDPTVVYQCNLADGLCQPCTQMCKETTERYLSAHECMKKSLCRSALTDLVLNPTEEVFKTSDVETSSTSPVTTTEATEANTTLGEVVVTEVLSSATTTGETTSIAPTQAISISEDHQTTLGAVVTEILTSSTALDTTATSTSTASPSTSAISDETASSLTTENTTPVTTSAIEFTEVLFAADNATLPHVNVSIESNNTLCPSSQVWSDCLPMAVPTCEQPIPLPAVTCSPGCTCDEFHLAQTNPDGTIECVPVSECPLLAKECIQRQLAYFEDEKKWAHGPPQCTENGDFYVHQCLYEPPRFCYCSTPVGEKIFLDEFKSINGSPEVVTFKYCQRKFEEFQNGQAQVVDGNEF